MNYGAAKFTWMKKVLLSTISKYLSCIAQKQLPEEIKSISLPEEFIPAKTSDHNDEKGSVQRFANIGY